MKNKSPYILIRFVYLLFDVISVVAAIMLAVMLRKGALNFDVSFEHIFFDRSNPYQLVFWAWLGAILFFNSTHNLYRTRREVAETREILLVIRSVFFSAMAVMAIVFSLKILEFSRYVFILIAVFSLVFLCIWRIIKRIVVEYLASHGYNNLNVLIIGAGRVGLSLAEEIRNKPGYGLNIVGFLDDEKTTQDLGDQGAVLGKVSEFSKIAAPRFVNEVFITFHQDHKIFVKLLEEAQDLGVGIRVVPQGYDLTTGKIFKYDMGFIPILEYCDVANKRAPVIKRIFDIVASLAAIILLMPVYILLAILVKCDSPGSIFHVSDRHGLGGQIFKMVKFRSMVQDAEDKLKELQQHNEIDGPIFKIKKDPRITPLGAFLRKYSLDELPQFFNVLKGDMSIVGPRPFLTTHIEKEDLRQLKRLHVRPGITGMWQISGRNDLSFNELLNIDMSYINNWSFWLDLKILFLTVPVVLKGRGAY